MPEPRAMHRPTRNAALIAALLSLAGCGAQQREAVGLRVPPPDEFLVVSRAPLVVPQDLTTLPPPQPGARSPLEPDPVRQAQAALTGSPVGTAVAPTAGEAALVGAAGATSADAGIRETLVAEAPEPQRRFGLDSFFGFPIDQTLGQDDDRLTPSEEAARLRGAGVPAPVAPPPPPDAGQLF
jgi:hypothetical protein